jgi:hypothetical protein
MYDDSPMFETVDDLFKALNSHVKLLRLTKDSIESTLWSIEDDQEIGCSCDAEELVSCQILGFIDTQEDV